jgi:hypothetical protein
MRAGISSTVYQPPVVGRNVSRAAEERCAEMAAIQETPRRLRA